MGRAIVALREQRELSRDELAEQVGRSRPSLEAIEKGEAEADWGTLRRLSHALRVPLDALIERAEELAPGRGGAEWQRWTRAAQKDREDPGGG